MARPTAAEDAFRAIADPTRRRILDLLSRGESPATELADEFHLSQPAISQHLKVLRDADLVRERRAGRQRIYTLHPRPLRDVAAWVTRYEEFWTKSLERLGDVLRKKHRPRGKS